MPTSVLSPTRHRRPVSLRSDTSTLAPADEPRRPERIVHELGRGLRAVQAEIAMMQERCQQLLDVVDTAPRDALHLSARIQGVEQCTRDAEQALARLRSRTPVAR